MMTGTTSTSAVIASLMLERNGIIAPAKSVMVASAARIPHAIRLTIPPISRVAVLVAPSGPVLPVRSTAEDNDVRAQGRVGGCPTRVGAPAGGR